MIAIAKDKALKARNATRLIFLVCGIGVASWAPMVPLAKARLQLNDAALGTVLLLLGAGALVSMPLAGLLVHRFGSRIIMLCSGLLMTAMLPLLLAMATPVTLGAALFFFGAGVGSIDVSMNAHAVVVQNLYGKHILSSFHGLFSVGGLLGSLGLGFLIGLGLSANVAVWAIVAMLVIILFSQYGSLLDPGTERRAAVQSGSGAAPAGRLLWLRPAVLFLGLMCFILFLAEGAMLDWSALFLREHRGVEEAFAGAGYAAFSVAMATMRLLGDGLVERFSPRKVVLWGTSLAAGGLLLAVAGLGTVVTLVGFVLLGLGAANTVPVFFSSAGHVPGVPSAIAIPAVTTLGYAGQLAGPALLGFLSYNLSLPIALACTAAAVGLAGLAFYLQQPAAPKMKTGVQKN